MKINQVLKKISFLGEISIASFGPLSNIGIAINLDADFTSHVNKFYVMGGSVRGVGNVAPNIEANFADEPEGTFLLFNSSREAQISLFPWETAISSKVEKVNYLYTISQSLLLRISI